MDKEQVYERLNNVFRDIFDDENIVLNENTNSDDIEDWDSLEHISLMVAIEKEFGIKFNIEDATKMKNVGEMVKIILSKI